MASRHIIDKNSNFLFKDTLKQNSQPYCAPFFLQAVIILWDNFFLFLHLECFFFAALSLFD